MATKNRVTIKLQNPNPLFEKWITEWRDKAIESDSKMVYCFEKALQSLKKYPLPLESGRDCGILKGFGEKLCKMLDKKLGEHKQNSNCLPEQSNTLNDGLNCKEYIPLYRSGAYAILITLYKKSLESEYLGYMLKADIIKEGKHLSDKSFVKPDPGSYYTAWSSMKTLLDKNLIWKKSSPAKYSLTNEGTALAQKLYKKTQGEYEEIHNLPSTSRQDNLGENNKNKAAAHKENPKVNKNKNKIKKLPSSEDNLDSQSSVTVSQDETFVFPPRSFDIILLVDKQEMTGSSKSNDDPLLDELNHLKVMFELRHLKVGDYTWICRETTSKQELVLPYIIERKRMDDLASSIKDGRFHEQKFRLKQCGMENLIYLIECYGTNTHVGLPISNLYQAATNTLVQDNFSIKFTSDLRNTVEYLSNLTAILRRLFENKTLVSCPKKNLNKVDMMDDLVSLMTFQDFNKNASKSHNFKVRELFIKQLLQLSGMSVEKALAIVEKYPTPKILYTEYQNSSETVGENLLSNLQFGKLKKKIGPVISKVIYQLFTNKY
ncbi:hypothetical protein FQR65_LT11837 [Abscondita terminalis]|nr:hypothetical protein FQR65_LT11837 [Abscondita terminalis]